MATTRPFAYNTGSTITGTEQVGNIAIGEDALRYDLDPGGVTWYMGCDEDPGYIVALPVPGTGKPTFLRSTDFSDTEYLKLVNNINRREGGQGNFNEMNVAREWLVNTKGYYTSYTGDTNQLTGWTNSVSNPYDTFTPSGRSEFRIVSSGGLARVFSNQREVEGYGFSPGPPPQWGLSSMSMNITWNSGTATVYLQLYYGTSQQSSTQRDFGGGNTIASGNIITPTETNVNYAIATTEACDITISNANWEITQGTPP